MISLALLFLGLVSVSQYCRCDLPYTHNNHETQDLYRKTTVKSGLMPYQITIYTTPFRYLCSGALISKKFAITAAHCINNRHHDELEVISGTTELEHRTEYSSRVKEIFIPENYSLHEPCRNDIALLKLYPRIIWIEDKFLSLPRLLDSQNEHNMERHLATISGYEKITKRLDRFNITYIQLFKTNCHIINQKECTISYMYKHCYVYDTQMCTFSNRININDTSALLIDRGTLLGIASCAKDCTHPNYSNLFTNVTRYVPWIRSKM